MSLLELFGIETRDDPATLAPNPSDDYWYSLTPGAKTAAGISVTESRALTYSACWAATMLLSSSQGMLPLKLYRKRSNGGSDVMTEHRGHRLVHNRPNPEMSPVMFKSSRTMQQVNRGNCYAEIDRNAGGQPDNLWPIHASRIPVENIRRENGVIVYYVNNNDGSKTPIKAENMLHVPSPISEDGIIGMGVITQARLSIGLGLATETHGAAYFGSGAMPKTVIEGLGKFKTKEDREEFRRQWNEMHGGPENANKPAILPEGMKITALNFSAEDSQFLETRQFSIEEVARWYGVPPHLIGHLLRATYCLPASEPVFTEHGPKSIADVAIGERVWSYDSDGKWVLSEVTDAACSGEDEILAIHTRTRTLRCNAGHRVLVRRKEFVPYTGGRGRSTVIDGEKMRPTFVTKYIPAGEIVPGDQLIAPDGLPDCGNEQAPTRLATIPFMESLGMLLGDGFYARSARGRRPVVSFGISHPEHATYMRPYIEAIENEFVAASKPYAVLLERNETKPLKHKVRDKNTTVFNSTSACQELEALGMVGTAKTKRIPAWVFGMSKALKLAFLRGYLDADGTVAKNGNTRFVSCNRELIEDVRHLMMSVGVRAGRVCAVERASHFNGYAATVSTLFSVSCSDPLSAMAIGSHTPEYHRRWQSAVSNRPTRKCKVYPFEAMLRPDLEAATLEPVTLVENEGIREKVYDLTVAGTHSFIANGVVVHNSNIEHLSLEFVKYSLMRWLVVWEQELNRKLLTPEEQKTMYFRHNVDALERGDLASRTAAFQQEFFNGKKTLNEWRAMDEENPIGPVGDVHFVQSAMIPVDIAAKGPQEPTAPPTEPKPDQMAAAIALAMSPVVTSLTEVAAGLKQLSTTTEANHAATIARLEAGEGEQKRLASVLDTNGGELAQLAASVTGLAQGTATVQESVKLLTEQAAASVAFNQQLAGALLRDVLCRLMSVEIHNVKQTAQSASKFDQRLLAFYDERHRRTMELALVAPVGAALSASGLSHDPAAFVKSYIDGHVAESMQQLLGCCDCQAEQLPARIEQCVARWHEERTSIKIGE